MSYLVLARKYRPIDFNAVAGQEHVIKTLRNSLKRDKIAHAYLFAGPRGVGKTSIARIFSKALNCQSADGVEPCGECDNCNEIARGSSLAVREIDGASHNSVDNVRELIESFRALPPPEYTYKVYIIDEVHMLSTAAFNALLKSLEEPPPNTVFILATTEAHKIPHTVISRCQRHEFRALGAEVIVEQLSKIAKSENIEIENGALRMMAGLADGSMRDAQSLLDRVHSFCDDKITEGEASVVLGAAERRVLLELSRCIFEHDPSKALLILNEAFSSGLDPALFIRDFVAHWRELFIVKVANESALKELRIPEDHIVDLQRQVAAGSREDLQDLLQLARAGSEDAIRSAHPHYALEALVVKMATREPVVEMARVIAALKSGAFKSAAEAAGPGNARARMVSKPAAAATASQAKKKQISIDWKDFLGFAEKSSHRMVYEQLKRISVDAFVAGRFSGKGPEFTVGYLTGPDNSVKLKQLLGEYSGQPDWKISLEKGESLGAPEPGSALHLEQKQQQQSREEKEQEALEHPSLKSLQEAFPGSTIEKVSVKS